MLNLFYLLLLSMMVNSEDRPASSKCKEIECDPCVTRKKANTQYRVEPICPNDGQVLRADFEGERMTFDIPNRKLSYDEASDTYQYYSTDEPAFNLTLKNAECANTNGKCECAPLPTLYENYGNVVVLGAKECPKPNQMLWFKRESSKTVEKKLTSAVLSKVKLYCRAGAWMLELRRDEQRPVEWKLSEASCINEVKEGNVLIRSVYDTYIRINEKNDTVELGKDSISEMDKWNIMRRADKVVIQSVGPPYWHLSSPFHLINSFVIVYEYAEAEEKWTLHFNEDDGSVSFLSAQNRWLSARRDGNLATSVNLTASERFYLEPILN